MSDTRAILFATDGSPSASAAQDKAFSLASELEAPLVVVSVEHAALPTVGYAGYGYPNVVVELREAERHRVEELLATTAAAACRAGVTCVTVSATGSAVEEICRIASEQHAQMIVVGSHGWGTARRLLSGSVSTGLVHQAPCPVLVIREQQHAAKIAEAA
jgi:nucleotide-binding universal stress UspA family protein